MKIDPALEARATKRRADAVELPRLRQRVRELEEHMANLTAENFYLRELVELLRSLKDLEP